MRAVCCQTGMLPPTFATFTPLDFAITSCPLCRCGEQKTAQTQRAQREFLNRNGYPTSNNWGTYPTGGLNFRNGPLH